MQMITSTASKISVISSLCALFLVIFLGTHTWGASSGPGSERTCQCYCPSSPPLGHIPEGEQRLQGTVSPSSVGNLRERYLDAVMYGVSGWGFRSPGLNLMENKISSAFVNRATWYGMTAPSCGTTMAGVYRLSMVKFAIQDVIRRNIPGDFLEAGVWKGGTSMFARAVFNAYGAADRKVWVCDSFQGLPPPSLGAGKEAKDDMAWSLMEGLRSSLPLVNDTFARFELTPNTEYVRGYFQSTMPVLQGKMKKLSVLRVDGDMYESFLDVLSHMYQFLAIGGWLIIDDMNIQVAVDCTTEFRKRHGITSKWYFHDIDLGGYWIKEKDIDQDLEMAFYRNMTTNRSSPPPLNDSFTDVDHSRYELFPEGMREFTGVIPKVNT